MISHHGHDDLVRKREELGIEAARHDERRLDQRHALVDEKSVFLKHAAERLGRLEEPLPHQGLASLDVWDDLGAFEQLLVISPAPELDFLGCQESMPACRTTGLQPGELELDELLAQ